MRQIEKGNKSRSNGKHNLQYLAVIASTLTIATPIVLFGLANHLTAQTITDPIASHSNPVNSEINSLESIRKRGKLIIGVKENLPPLGFRDRDGNLVGLEIELARELAKELNIPIEFVPLKNRDRLSAIANNHVDLAIAQITVTNNRARLVDFSLPYYTDSSIAIAKQGLTRQDLSQPIAIAVLKNSASIAVIQSQFPKAAIIGANSYEDGLTALQAGKVTAFVGDRSSLSQWLKEHPEYEIIGQPLAVHSIAIALPRGLQHLDLRVRVLATVEKWRKGGWLKERVKYWGL